MSKEIPKASFRTEYGFVVKPELEIDPGPGGGLIMGCNNPYAETQGIFLGKHSETRYRNVWLDVRGAHVLYVMGKRRSGKSYTLGAIAEGLVSQQWIAQGTTPQGVLVLDTMNVFLTMPYSVAETFAAGAEASKELVKWRLETEHFPLTLFSPRGCTVPDGLSATEIALRPSDLGSEEWCGLFEADPFADPLGHLISELYARVAEDGYTDISTRRQVPPKGNFILLDMLSALENADELQRYPRETRESLRRRLDAVRRLPIFSDIGLDVRQLIQPGQISILLLRDLDQGLRSVLVGLIVKRVIQLRGISEQQERMIPLHVARAEKLQATDPASADHERELAARCKELAISGLPRSWIIIDEAHNYIPSKGAVSSRKPLKKYVDEGRNLGLSIVVATQQPSGLDPSIQRNADVLLIHALSHHDDIMAAAGMINTACPTEAIVDGRKIEGPRTFETLVRNLPLGYALAATDRANRLFPVRIRPRVTVHGGVDY